MSSHLKHKSFFVISLSLFLLITAPDAENIQSSVDANEAIEQVNHNFTEPREGEFLIDTNIVYCPHPKEQDFPAIAFDDTRYLVVWQDKRNNIFDIYGAKIDTSGTVIDSHAVSLQSGDQISPGVSHGSGDQLLIAYSGWTDSIGSHSAEIMRIWGKLYPFIGIKEDIKLKNQVTRFDLQIYPNPIHKECNIKYMLSQETSINISVFDVTGRFVKDVINETQKVGIYCKTFDVGDLPQGVYFIRLKAENYSDTKKAIFIK